VPSTKADILALLVVSLARENVFREKSEVNIACVGLSKSIFGLNACLGSQFVLHKGIDNVICLVTIDSKPVCCKVQPTNAEGCLLVYAGNDAFSSIRAIFTNKTARLECNAVPVEDGIELTE
jgi:hypothetical protein